jgi:hypothetical protein
MQYVLQAQEAKNIFQKVQTKYRPIYYFSKIYKKYDYSIYIFIYLFSFIHSFSFRSQLEHRAPFGVFVITHTIRHKVGLLWTSDQPVAETSTYTGQHNI